MAIPLQPLSDRVLVEKIKKEEQTASGIIVPHKETEGTHVGVVIAIGPGRETDEGKMIKAPVSVGQKILFSWGEKVELHGKEYVIVSESQILGVVQE